MARTLDHEAQVKQWIREAVEDYMRDKEDHERAIAMSVEEMKIQMESEIARKMFQGVAAEPPPEPKTAMEKMKERYGL